MSRWEELRGDPALLCKLGEVGGDDDSVGRDDDEAEQGRGGG